MRHFNKILVAFLLGACLLAATTSAQVATEESVYVFGHVKVPRICPYTDGMNVGDAIESAGGMTEHGSAENIILIRLVDGRVGQARVTLDTSVQPRDSILVLRKR
jgi:protein involved in polysaccharide export with SLBB domain